jgi:hypothetical protein
MSFYDGAWERKPEPPQEVVAANGAKLRIAFVATVRYMTYGYVAELVSGAWPPDGELVVLCNPILGADFGGEVLDEPAPGRKRVLVQTD